MAYDEYRERRRIELEDELRGSDLGRRGFRGSAESRWPGESSWGYGREYDEGPANRYRTPSDYERSLRFEGRPQPTRFPAQPRRHRVTGMGIGSLGWEPEGGFGAGSGFLYGGDPGAQGFQPSYRSTGYGYGGYGYGSATHLANIPRGRFTGLGPKGYQRSDERIREDVSEELSQSGEIDATEIEVRVAGREVTLEGEVDTREEKRLAEDIAEACPGVRDVHNNLKVKKGFFARLLGTDEDEDKEREEAYSSREYR